MDERRFDGWTRTMAGAGSRRVALRALAGGALAAGLARLGLAEAAAACKKKGQACDQDQDCCSKRCKHGKCLCSKVGKGCKGSTDCCSSDNVAGTCSGATNKCCRLPNEPCAQTNHCCLDGSLCEAESGGGPKRCCLRQGEYCGFAGGDEACCNGLICAVDSLQCEVPGAIYCLHIGETCAQSAHCCGSLACCSQDCCGALCGEQKCCVPPGGDCEWWSDCCFHEFGSEAVCEAAPGGRKRCCIGEGHLCNHAVTGECCNGLVCREVEGSFDRCAKLGLTAPGAE